MTRELELAFCYAFLILSGIVICTAFVISVWKISRDIRDLWRYLRDRFYNN